MSFDIRNNNCLHAVNRKLAEKGHNPLFEMAGNPESPLDRHRYAIDLARVYEAADSSVSFGIVLMTKSKLIHHFGLIENGLIYSFEDDGEGWLTEDALQSKGYRHFEYLKV